jgi:hypothetical protein
MSADKTETGTDQNPADTTADSTDTQEQSVIDASDKWEFLAAELTGRAVCGPCNIVHNESHNNCTDVAGGVKLTPKPADQALVPMAMAAQGRLHNSDMEISQTAYLTPEQAEDLGARLIEYAAEVAAEADDQ